MRAFSRGEWGGGGGGKGGGGGMGEGCWRIFVSEGSTHYHSMVSAHVDRNGERATTTTTKGEFIKNISGNTFVRSEVGGGAHGQHAPPPYGLYLYSNEVVRLPAN